MTETPPERIWAKAYSETHGSWLNFHPEGYVEYTRTDLIPSRTYEDGVRAAAEACTNVMKSYDVLKADGKTYEPMRVQKAAKSMVGLTREDILAYRS